MSVERFPDWRKIGKQIGKKLRGILEPSDPGPSRQERLDQRLRDGLRGLVYFDNSEEIGEWEETDVDPVQRANTPLLKRASHHSIPQSRPTSKVLLCHDYSGGYHEWEGVRPSLLREKVYACHYLQYVEIFVYFSHKLVCIPPASWINTMHRNGVKILGTFLVENDRSDIECVLDQDNGDFVIAKGLARMAYTYGFDGWLLNVESEFPPTTVDPAQRLSSFIRQLKRLLGPEKTVIWYDALTIENNVEHQNALAPQNLDFALAADAFFTNYRWSETEILRTQGAAKSHCMNFAEIYFGIDVWAQNTNTNMIGRRRITYPREGGGGTLTGLAVRKLANNGFSSAIFAPGWPYEHFSTSLEEDESQAEDTDRAMWEGTALPENLDCDCAKSKPHDIAGYKQNAICTAAREFPAGSHCFLETDFRRPFLCKSKSGGGEHLIKPMLGSQAILPMPDPCPSTSDGKLIQSLIETSANRPSLLLKLRCSKADSPIMEKAGDENQAHLRFGHTTLRTALFRVNMPRDRDMVAVVDFQSFLSSSSCTTGIYTKTEFFEPVRHEYEDHALSSDQSLASFSIYLKTDSYFRHSRLVEIGLYFDGVRDHGQDREILLLYSLVIKPNVELRQQYEISDIIRIHRQAGSHRDKRLTWEFRGSRSMWPTELPWSDTTGPFSVFSIKVAGSEVGEAHSLEFPLRESDFLGLVGPGVGVEITVTGHYYGGGSVSASRLFGNKDDLVGQG